MVREEQRLFACLENRSQAPQRGRGICRSAASTAHHHSALHSCAGRRPGGGCRRNRHLKPEGHIRRWGGGGRRSSRRCRAGGRHCEPEWRRDGGSSLRAEEVGSSADEAVHFRSVPPARKIHTELGTAAPAPGQQPRRRPTGSWAQARAAPQRQPRARSRLPATASRQRWRPGRGHCPGSGPLAATADRHHKCRGRISAEERSAAAAVAEAVHLCSAAVWGGPEQHALAEAAAAAAVAGAGAGLCGTAAEAYILASTASSSTDLRGANGQR